MFQFIVRSGSIVGERAVVAAGRGRRGRGGQLAGAGAAALGAWEWGS